MLRLAGVDDVELLLIGRKTDAVGLIHIAGNHRDFAGVRIQAVDIGRKFEGRLVPFVVRHNAVARIGEPDRAIRMHCEIIRRIERFALKVIRQNRDRAVMLGARDPARIVLAGHEPSLSVAGIAVAVI